MGLRAHWFQHAPFEGLGSIESWLAERRARVRATRFFDRPQLPDLNDFDLLIVMGGPMSVNEDAAYPWLREEKRLIAQAIDRGTPVLGVCLGAQLIAGALGAKVRRNTHAEIGWFPVENIAGARDGLPRTLPSRFDAFHWHGETFDLPAGALRIARSEACENQAFTIGDRVAGFQFHLETTVDAARALIDNCRGDLVAAPFVQSESRILGRPDRFARINGIMGAVLSCLIAVR